MTFHENQNNPVADDTQTPGEVSDQRHRPRGRIFRRFGCAVLLAAWFLFLLTPCLVVYLAVAGEIVFKHSDLPEDQLRIWTVSSTTARGLALSNARRVDTPDGQSCTLTDAYFFVWQGKGSPAQHFCACYAHHDNQFDLALTGDDACKKAGE